MNANDIIAEKSAIVVAGMLYDVKRALLSDKANANVQGALNPELMQEIQKRSINTIDVILQGVESEIVSDLGQANLRMAKALIEMRE